jgi:hypothetical protein
MIFTLVLILSSTGITHAQRMGIARLFRLQSVLSAEAKKAKGFHLAPKSNLEQLEVTTNLFNVALLNDSIVTVRGRIDFRNYPNTLIEAGKNGKVFKLADTQFISVLWEGGDESIGVSGDSTWLFRVNSNNLNLYASVPYYVWDCIVAVQKGDEGEIVKLDAQNLEDALSDSDNALSFFIDGRIEESISAYNGVFVDKNKKRKGAYNWPDPNRRIK